jgi:hypothetical protein
MGVIVQCGCGNYVQIANESGEQQGQCPRCGKMVSVPMVVAIDEYGRATGRGVAVPTRIPPELQAPGKPPCCLVIHASNVDLKASFDASPVLISLAEAFAKKLRKHYNVEIASTPGTDCVNAIVNILKIDEGSRWVRYMFLLAGHTIFEIEGEIVSPTGQRMPFRLKDRGMFGLFGGDSLMMLRAGATSLGKKIARMVLKPKWSGAFPVQAAG